MQVFYVILLCIFLVLIVLYVFMSIRLTILTKKKIKTVENSWDINKLVIVKEYKDATRVTLKEIFLGIDNGKKDSSK